MSAAEKFIGKALPYIRLTAADRALIAECLTPMQLKKGAYYVKSGAINPGVSYVETGLLRSYFFDQSGKEITAGFIQEENLCTDLISFQSGESSQRNIEALTDCQLHLIDREALLTLREKIPDWTYFEQHYIANMLLRKVDFQRKSANHSASAAYEAFAEMYPQANRYAPRYQIASFLGISPYTLSRLK